MSELFWGVIEVFNWIVLTYFVLLNGVYLATSLFAFGALRDMVARSLPGGKPEGTTFASVLAANLGPTICEHFYFPYARKMWGHEPEELSGIQARKRVSAGTFKKLMQRLAKPPGAGRFFYPRRRPRRKPKSSLSPGAPATAECTTNIAPET